MNELLLLARDCSSFYEEARKEKVRYRNNNRQPASGSFPHDGQLHCLLPIVPVGRYFLFRAITGGLE